MNVFFAEWQNCGILLRNDLHSKIYICRIWSWSHVIQIVELRWTSDRWIFNNKNDWLFRHYYVMIELLPRASKTSLLKTGGSLTSFTVILTLTHGSDWSIFPCSNWLVITIVYSLWLLRWSHSILFEKLWWDEIKRESLNKIDDEITVSRISQWSHKYVKKINFITTFVIRSQYDHLFWCQLKCD